MKREYRRKSLPFKIILLFLVMALVLDIGITVISSAVYKNKLTEEYERVCVGVSEAVASNINGNRIEEWLAGEKKQEYQATEEKFINVMESYSDIKSIRVCKINNNGMQTVYDIERDSMENKGFSAESEFDSYIGEKRDALLEGENVDVINSVEGGTHFMAVLTPVKDKMNNVTAYAICEISTEDIRANSFDFAKKIFIVISLASVILVLAVSFYINRKFVSPLGKIDKKLRDFAGDANSGEKTKESLNKIKVKGNDEISRIHNGFIKLIDEISMKTNEVKEFDAEIMRRMNEAVNKDEE